MNTEEIDLLFTWFERVTFILSYIVAGVAFVWRKRLRRWWHTNEFFRIGGVVSQEKHWDCIILNPSNPDVWKKLLETTKPRNIGLIKSNWSARFIPQIIDYSNDNGSKTFIVEIQNESAISEIKKNVLRLIDDLNSQNIKDIAVDITGGKKPMAIAMFMAAEEARCETIYIDTDWDEGSHKVINSRSGLVHISSPKKA